MAMYLAVIISWLSVAIVAQRTPVKSVNQGPYVSEYYNHCPAKAMTAAAARSACLGFHNGWDIATIPTSAALKTIDYITKNDKLPPPFFAWVGISKDSRGDWINTAGRLAGTVYYVGEYSSGSCRAIDYNPFNLTGKSTIFNTCSWGAGEPNNLASKEFSPDENCTAAVSPNDASPLYLEDHSCAQTHPCVVCERSHCQLTVDCHPLNTLNMSGAYFPSCTCKCKPGFHGTRCEETTDQLPSEGNKSPKQTPYTHFVNQVAYDGNTPLHVAAAGGFVNIVKLLVAEGANVSLRNNEGQTPLDCFIASSDRFDAEKVKTMKALLAPFAS